MQPQPDITPRHSALLLYKTEDHHFVLCTSILLDAIFSQQLIRPAAPLHLKPAAQPLILNDPHPI
jgi:hypothetical protein